MDPFSISAEQHAAEPPAIRILVVEDERIVARALQGQLRTLGHEVPALTYSGEEAILLAESLRPDLVLMDIQLDGPMDGIEAADIIRNRFQIPIVFLTAFANKEALDRAKRAQPFGYILKPYLDRELDVVIEMALYKHRTRRKLEERERWLTATLKSIGDGVIATDREGRVAFMNAASESMTGWPLSQAVGQDEAKVFHILNDVTRRPIDSPLKKALSQRELAPLSNNTILIARDGTQRRIEDCASPILDDNGVPLGGVLVYRDVSGEYELARQREESLALLDVAFNSMPGLFFLFDETGKILRWNKNVEAFSGYTAEEIASMKPLDFTAGDETALAEERIGEVFRTGQASAEVHFVAKDGTRTPYFYTAQRVLLGGKPCVVGTGIDLTQRRRLEEQFRQAQKMEAVGRLAGGVAHDFNNLLTIINGYCDILMAALPDHARGRAMVEQISKAGQRAAGLTQQLLAYSRKQILQPRVFDLNGLISSIDTMLRRMIGEDIELITIPTEAPCLVKADPNQIEQVIMNLAVNARDAMPTGGRLTIATRRIDLDEKYTSEFAEVRPGPYVQLSVADSGSGMDPTTLARLFEPFFTTKEQGKGTGLGLATVFGIVKQSGGHIRVFSEFGRGSLFHVYLPILLDDSEKPRPHQDVQEMPRGSETVLLVEDEHAVRYLSHFILQRSGYNVLEASNGVEALEICGRHSGAIDLLATDIVMPRMGGRQLAETLQKLYPKIRILYMSGYTEDAVFRQGIVEEKHDFLQKPFTLSELTKRIREILDRK